MTKNWRGEISFPVGELRAARLARGITTQALLAEKVHIKREVVIDAEKGRHISAEHAKAIAHFLKIDLSQHVKEQDYGGLIGRNLEIAEALRALAGPGPVRLLVMGGPGLGKTALTLAAARIARSEGRYPPGRTWFVALETAASAGMTRVLILRALGLDPEVNAFEDALEIVRNGRGLLTLDNLETPWEQDTSELVECLALIFREAAGVDVLGSVRGRESPTAPWTHKVPLKPLTAGAASALFRSIAPLVPKRDPHLGPLIEALGGLPLAIVLMARRAEPYESLARIWEEWQASPSLVQLTADRRQSNERNSSVLTSVEVSLRSDRLGEGGRLLFRLLGYSPAGMAAVDYEALLGQGAAAAEREVLTVGLAEQRGSRLDLLPPVREAATHLAPPTIEEQAAWCSYYVQLVGEVGSLIGRTGGSEAAARLVPEIANVSAALRRGMAPAMRERGIVARVRGAIRGTGKLIGYAGLEAPPILGDLARDFESAGDRSRAAQCLVQCADYAFRRSEYELGKGYYARALQMFQGLGDRASEAHCQEWLSDIARDTGNPREAERLCDEAIDLYVQACAAGVEISNIDNSPVELGLADAVWSKAELLRARQAWDGAAEHYKSAREMFDRHGSLRGEANCLRGMANLELDQGNFEAASRDFLRAMAIYEGIALPLALGCCLMDFADLHQRQRRIESATRHYESALKLFKQVRNRKRIELCEEGLALAKARSIPPAG